MACWSLTSGKPTLYWFSPARNSIVLLQSTNHPRVNKVYGKLGKLSRDPIPITDEIHRSLGTMEPIAPVSLTYPQDKWGAFLTVHTSRSRPSVCSRYSLQVSGRRNIRPRRASPFSAAIGGPIFLTQLWTPIKWADSIEHTWDVKNAAPYLGPGRL